MNTIPVAEVEALAARHYNEGVGEWSGRPSVCGGCGKDWPCADRQAIDAVLTGSPTTLDAVKTSVVRDALTDAAASLPKTRHRGKRNDPATLADVGRHLLRLAGEPPPAARTPERHD